MDVVSNKLLLGTWTYVPPFILLTLSSALSTIGSGTIIYWIVWNRKSDSLVHRIMLGLSCTDVVSSIHFLLQPYLVPKESGMPFAVSNSHVPCEVLSVLAIFGYASWMYSAELSLYFYLSIVRGLSDRDAVNRLEPWVHVFPLVAVVVTGVLLSQMKSSGMQLKTGFCTTNGIDEEEGLTALFLIHDILLTVVYVLIPVTVGVFCTWKVYTKVRTTSERQSRWSFRNVRNVRESSQPSPQVRAVGIQCVCYTIGFLNSLLVTVLFAALVSVRLSDPVAYGIVCFVYICFPLQGAINCVVFFRPSLVRWKASNPDNTWLWACGSALSGDSAPPPSTEARPKRSPTTHPTGLSSSEETTQQP